MPIGLWPLASPTARKAAGDPICSAISPYVRVSPYGIVSSASQTRRWNAVPTRSRSRSKSIRVAREVRLELLDGIGERVVVGRPAARGSAHKSGRPSADASAGRSLPARVNVPTGLSIDAELQVLHHFSFGGQSLTAWSRAVHRCWVA